MMRYMIPLLRFADYEVRVLLLMMQQIHVMLMHFAVADVVLLRGHWADPRQRQPSGRRDCRNGGNN